MKLSDPIYAIVPFLDNWQQTEQTLLSLGEVVGLDGILAINNGGSAATRQRFEAYCRGHEGILPWHHCPPLPSLAATWNAALRFCWASGSSAALVCNNDILLHPETLTTLIAAMQATDALFVSAVNAGAVPETLPVLDFADASGRGGPDFSCYLLSREGHERYPFDEGFCPAYAEDCDTHRRMLLAGDGDRIFSLNVPYEHVGGGSGTLKSMSPRRRAELTAQIEEGSRTYYAKKWGGGVNAEEWALPFNLAQDIEACDHKNGIRCFACPTPEDVTTPALFDAVRRRWRGESA